MARKVSNRYTKSRGIGGVLTTVQRPEARLVSLASCLATGALEVRAGKKRWVLFLDQGDLVLTHSNLKGDSEAELRVRYPDVDVQTLTQLQAASRLAGVLRAQEGVSMQWHAGTSAPQRVQLNLARELLRASHGGLADARVASLLEEAGVHSPAFDPAQMIRFESCELEAETLTWLGELNGSVAMSEVLAACPAGSRLGSRLMLIAAWLGALAPEEDGLAVGGEAVLDDEALSAVRGAVSRIATAETHFQVLGPEWDAPSDDFRTSFFGLARLLHPDRLGSFPEDLRLEAERAFDLARQAWEIVGDPNSRRAYTDHAIHGKKTEDEIAREEMEAIFAAETDFKRGLVAFHAGQIRVAQRAFDTAVRQDPGEPEYKMYLGYTNFRVNRTTNTEAAERGRQMLMEVVDGMKERLSAAGDKPPPRLTDLSSRSWMLMGRVYRDQADAASGEEATQFRAAAKRCFLQALRVNPANADAQRELKRMKAERDRESAGFFSGLFRRSKKR